MKISKNQRLVFIYRLVFPILDPLKLITGTIGYFKYLVHLYQFNRTFPGKIEMRNIFPVVDERIKYTPLDSHYFYQQLWAFEKIHDSKTKIHHDIGSTYQMSGYVSKICKAVFADIRPIKTNLKNLEVVTANILNLPFKDKSIQSLSCLHVIEHIGLGRYDDYLDVLGPEKSASEIDRVLLKGAKLYLSTPVGEPVIYFNAHRVFAPMEIPAIFSRFKLESFSVVTDDGEFLENVPPENYSTSKYACGMYEFTKK